MDPRPNIEKSKRQQQWNFLLALLPGLFGALLSRYDDSTPDFATGALMFGWLALLVGGSLWVRSPALDVQAMVARRKRFDQAIVLAAIVITPLFWLMSNGDWSDRAWSALLPAAAFTVIRRSWLWQIGERKARELEEIARRVGLTENPLHPRVYEGMRGKECVRVEIVEPMILHSLGLAAWLEFVLLALIVVAAVWHVWAWAGVAALATLAWGWYASRFRVRVVTLREDGTDERRTLYRVGDVAAAIGSDSCAPVETGRFAMESEVDLQDLLAEVEIAAGSDDLLTALRMIGDAGYPETIPLLLYRLRQRKEAMSPRSVAAAEAAVARIRERHHLPDSGTLAISDHDDAGTLAVAHEAGTLARPPRDRSR